MDLTFTAEDEAFRKNVRAWLRDNVPRRRRDEPTGEYGSPERIRAAKAWQRRLHAA